MGEAPARSVIVYVPLLRRSLTCLLLTLSRRVPCLFRAGWWWGAAVTAGVAAAERQAARGWRPVGAGHRGDAAIRTGDAAVFCKVVAVAPARVRRDGRVQAQGSPAQHATLGPVEEWLEQAGPGVIDGIAGRAALRERSVKGERKRLLTRAFMIRVHRADDADAGRGRPGGDHRAGRGPGAGAVGAGLGAGVGTGVLGDWRIALGPEPLEELRDIVLRASWREHEDRDWRAVIIGRIRPLKAGSLDGTLLRVPDTPANRAAFGSVGTGDDSARSRNCGHCR